MQQKDYLFIYLFIHCATEAAHITLQTYKIKHKALKTAKTLHNRETKFRYQHISKICEICVFVGCLALRGVFGRKVCE